MSKIYKLKNDTLDISISSIGAELKSIKYKEEEYLYKGDSKYWHRSSPLLFPIVGRLKNNNYKYKNKKYTLAIHGFARFKDFYLVEEKPNSLIFCLKEDEHSLKHYPFTFKLLVKYSLENNKVNMDYNISSKEDIIFGFGTHPAFLLKASINDTFIEFEKEEEQQAYKLDLKNGCIKNQEGLKLRGKKLKLFKEIFSEDALIFKNLNSNFLSLKNGDNKKTVKVHFKNFPYLGIWAKVNAPYVCIEPWCSHADDINTTHNIEEKKDLIKLKANEEFKRTLNMEFF